MQASWHIWSTDFLFNIWYKRNEIMVLFMLIPR